MLELCIEWKQKEIRGIVPNAAIEIYDRLYKMELRICKENLSDQKCAREQ